MPLPETAKYPSALVSDVDLLNWKNIVPSNSSVTLAAGIASTDTTLTVATGTGTKLPSSNFVVSLEDELIFVGTRTTDSLTSCVRGYESTTAASHASGVSVNQRITAKAHNQAVAELVAIETALGTNLSNVEQVANKNANSGYAGLDSSGKVLISHLPSALNVTVTTVTANTTVGSTADVIYLCNPAAAGITMTLPSCSSATTRSYYFKNTSAFTITITPQTGELIDGESSWSLVNQYQGVWIVTSGSNWYTLSQ